MENKEFLLVKSSLFNALIPQFLRHTFYNSSFFVFLYMVYYLFDKILELDYDLEVILLLVFITLLISFLMILRDLINIVFRTYKFYPRRVEYNYKFFKEENHTINYSQITDIQVKKNIWDRICGVGDIIIHTGNDLYHEDKKSLTIKDIRKPEIIKEQIAKRIHL